MRWESALAMGQALAGAAFAGGCKESEASTPPADGAALFAATCSRCHGANGKGGAPAAPGQPAPRDLPDGAFLSTKTDAELRAAMSGGKPPGMPGFAAVYSLAQLDALVGQIRRLGGK
jgi:mono/diheme cytochrome c family protein